jgi:hypothetical protein
MFNREMFVEYLIKESDRHTISVSISGDSYVYGKQGEDTIMFESHLPGGEPGQLLKNHKHGIEHTKNIVSKYKKGLK